ncbi:MAG: hypothetical protein PVI90_17730, partial [Desulfobacteraceae bacterium]
MKWSCDQFAGFNSDKQQVLLLAALLPPPLSLDLLFTISGISPVKILQAAEELVDAQYLSKCSGMGPGYYYVPRFEAARKLVRRLPKNLLFSAFRKVVAGIMAIKDDGPKKWLALAHVYQVSGVVLEHYKELVLAGDYCQELNLPVDASTYYLLALEAMEKAELDSQKQNFFIDAAIGICTCRNTALSSKVQIRFLRRALEYCGSNLYSVRRVRLTVLLAKALTRSGNYEEAAKNFENAWQMVLSYDFPKEVRLKVALANSEFLFWQGFVDKAIERYEAAIDNHEELPLDGDTLKRCAMQGWIYGVSGQTAHG